MRLSESILEQASTGDIDISASDLRGFTRKPSRSRKLECTNQLYSKALPESDASVRLIVLVVPIRVDPAVFFQAPHE